MRKLAIVAASLGAIWLVPTSTFAASTMTDLSSQSVGVEVGPGGVRVEEGHRRWQSERRGERREMRRGGGLCAELRAACLNKERMGEQGEGNCRRYRRTCR